MYLTEQEIAKIKDFFRTKPVRKAYLFGSYARGEADAESDVDLLVDLDLDGFKDSVLEFFIWHEDLGELLGKNVDVIAPNKHPSRFKSRIEPDLTLLYEQQAA